MSIPDLKHENDSALHTIPLFLSRTYKIVNDPSHNSIIQWNEDQYGFHIKDVAAFKSQILPKYFKHRNIHSFSRQLNMYGFKRRTLQDGSLYFSHDFFQKNQISKLKLIHRKCSRRSQIMGQRRVGFSQLGNSKLQKIVDEIRSYKKKNQLLEKLLHIIAQQNYQAVTQNHQILQALRQIEEHACEAIKNSGIDTVSRVSQERAWNSTELYDKEVGKAPDKNSLTFK